MAIQKGLGPEKTTRGNKSHRVNPRPDKGGEERGRPASNGSARAAAGGEQGTPHNQLLHPTGFDDGRAVQTGLFKATDHQVQN
eukprot:CAMPEP_0206457060 /NCGR_PEP_ID=MMETSP0324_2-20121206/22738_1 /ASSEMBLY_ACC=CAM_ASM_000836 /TAXON_ID=2866 /ORGANISM="Crypthecodinium cohnii, Strain Seligo" /LENGTH=82 /DNA_ID=CAMNT_0053928113 /DNA_START=102 /DNA_END=350 /DNA_ORIENTATION=-